MPPAESRAAQRSLACQLKDGGTVSFEGFVAMFKCVVLPVLTGLELGWKGLTGLDLGWNAARGQPTPHNTN